MNIKKIACRILNYNVMITLLNKIILIFKYIQFFLYINFIF